MAQAVKQYPNRFEAFAVLPWSEPEAATRELERAVKKLGFKGALLSGRPSAGDAFLDDPQYTPVLEMAAGLNVPIYLHPGTPIHEVQKLYYGGLGETVSARLSLFGWGWHAESGVQLIRMILGGVFEKFPKLQVISGHWGEMVPFYLSRLGLCRGRSQGCRARSQTILPAMSM